MPRSALLIGCALAFGMTASARMEPAPLTLRQAIAEALRASPALGGPDEGRTLAAMGERQSAARFGLKVTPAFQTSSDPSGLGQQSFGVAATKRLHTGALVQFNVNAYQFGGAAAAPRDTGYSFGVSQPLLRGWSAGATADLGAARRHTESAARGYADARQRLVVSVADAYFAVVRSREMVGAAGRALERARHLRTASAARSSVGLATELDVLRAELLASQSEAALVAQRESLDSAVDALKMLIGREADGGLDVADAETTGEDLAVAEPVDALVHSALAARFEVREARDRISDTRRAQSIARWNLLPPINLEAQYTRRGLGGGAAPAADPLVNGWRFSVSSSYALDRRDETAAAAVMAVSLRAAEREARDTERRVADEVRRAHRAWRRTETTMAIQNTAVDLAERQLRLAQIRYERGVAGNFDVVDAENGLFQAQSGLIGAQADRALAGLTLRRIAGRLDPEVFQR